MTSPTARTIAVPPPASGARVPGLVLTIGGMALAGALVAALALVGQVDLGATLRKAAGADLPLLALICALGAAQMFVCAEKWRVAAAADGSAPIPRGAAYAATALGGGFALVAPIQIALAMTRAAGARLFGGVTFLRGGAASLFEQIFDVAVFGCCALAAVVTMAFGLKAEGWFFVVCVSLGATWLGMGAGFALLHRIVDRLNAHDASGKIGRLAGRLAASGFIVAGLAKKLFVLSIARLALLGAMSALVGPACGLDIPAWTVIAAVPFAAVATSLSPTPAGLGVTEWAFASTLAAFGTPLDIAMQWAVVNRVLMTVNALVVALTGVLCTVLTSKDRS